MDPIGEQRGESWMPNTSAWPNDASVCSLSQILEIGRIPPKYFLSGKACAGILRQAEKRGKELPEQLLLALQAVADSQRTSSALVEPSPCASTGGGMNRIDAESETLVAVTTLAIRGRGDQSNLEYRTDGTANALLTPNGGRAGIGVGAIQQAMAVRRLTPEECESLQGFCRGFTNIPGAADGPRYKALGNSMAVPVMAWIGRRIQEAYAND
jgi:C-5 cytosine-specific DNA methylase